MLIRMINGIYGHREKDENGAPSVFVQPKTRHDPPFDVDADAAERLVRDGIAEYADPSPVATLLQGEAEAGAGKNLSDGGKAVEDQETARLDPDQLQGMTVTELKTLAEDMGLDTSDCKKKADLVELIASEEFYADEDGEAPPDLNVEAPVV